MKKPAHATAILLLAAASFRSTMADEPASKPAPPVPRDASGEVDYETHTPAQWREKLAAWRKALESDDEAQRREAKAAILSIRDPNAFGLLKYMLAREESLDIERLYLAAIAHVGGEQAVRMLVEIAVKDVKRNGGTAAVGLGTMGEEDRALAVRRLSRYLRSKQLQARAVQVLALGELIRPLEQGERPDDALTRGLIDALALKTTKYAKRKFFVYRFVFGPNSAGGSSFRGRGNWDELLIPFEVRSPNETAHELLQQYTHEQLPLDQDQWSQWYRASSE